MLKPPSLDRLREELSSRKTPIYTSWHSEVEPIKWAKVFRNLFENHRDRKTADIIYTLIHRGIFTRKRLLRAGLDISDSCPRGCQCPETLDHLFFSCDVSGNLWEFSLRFLKCLDPNFKTTVKAFVIQGFEVGGSYDNTFDDVRMAFVASVWKVRNAAMLADSENINALSYFRSKLLSMLGLRMLSNVKEGKNRTHGFDTIAEFSPQNSKLYFTI